MIEVDKHRSGRAPLDKTSCGSSPRINLRLTTEQLATYNQIGGANTIRDFLEGLGNKLAKSIQNVKNFQDDVDETATDVNLCEIHVNNCDCPDEFVQYLNRIYFHSIEINNQAMVRLENEIDLIEELKQMYKEVIY